MDVAAISRLDGAPRVPLEQARLRARPNRGGLTLPQVIPRTQNPENIAEARVALTFGHRFIPKGTRLSRSDPVVMADPQYWQIPAVPLVQVLNDESTRKEG